MPSGTTSSRLNGLHANSGTAGMTRPLVATSNVALSTMVASAVQTLANVPIKIVLPANLKDRSGSSLTVEPDGEAANGTLEQQSDGNLVYRSGKLFVGDDNIRFSLVNAAGQTVYLTMKVTVLANPTIGEPFDDEGFYDDETGWDVDEDG